MCGSGGAQSCPASRCIAVSHDERSLVAAACAAALVQRGLLSKRHEARSKGADPRPPRAASRRPGTRFLCVAGAARTVAAADVALGGRRRHAGGPVLPPLRGRGAGLPRPGRHRARVAARALSAAAPCGCSEENPIASAPEAAGASSRSRSARRWSGPTRASTIAVRPSGADAAGLPLPYGDPLCDPPCARPRTPFLLNCRADFLMASYADGVEKAAGLADAACCGEGGNP